MKKIYTLFLALIFAGSLMAQTPQSFKYQAVARDASGDVVADQAVGMQISILQGSTSGTAVYVETFTPTTNEFGLINLNIGAGTLVSGDLTTIDWSADTYFLKIEMDITGGTTYEEYGTSQLLSVPYALHAKTAANAFSGNYSDLSGAPTNVSTFTNDAGYLISFTETDPVYTGSQAANITATDITNLGNLSGVNTGDQDLSSLATKTALGDSTAQVRSEIPDVSGFLTSYTETDPTFTAWDKSYNDLINTPGIIDSINAVIDTTTQFVRTEVDGSVTNEIQTISRTGLTVTLSNGGGTFQDSVNVYTAGTGVDITNNVISTTGPTPLAIGDSYGGGIIFWLDASGQHGLIAATDDQSTGIQWYNGSYTTTGATLDAVYAGKANTEIIISVQGAGSYAAQVCDDYSVTVNNEYYNDWYLPSKYELNLMYLQKAAIGGFASGNYWSSTEYDIYFAWRQYFGTGGQYIEYKNYTYYVRAVRAF